MEEKKEAVYLVDEYTYLHLKENENRGGFVYKTYDRATGDGIYSGVITYAAMNERQIRNPMTCACVLAVEEVGMRGEIISEVALRTMDRIRDAKRSYRRAHRDDLHDHSIRFITSNYDELFRIPNRGKVRVDYPDRSFITPCEYIDDYHTRIGGDIFHICQFAEMLERCNGKVSPEPEMMQDQAAWQIGHREYLFIQSTEAGWDYTVYDKDFGEVDGGQIDRSELTIRECRDMILADFGWQNRNFTEVDRDMVEENAAEVAEAHRSSVLDQLHTKMELKGTDSVENGKAVPLTSREQQEECL